MALFGGAAGSHFAGGEVDATGRVTLLSKGECETAGADLDVVGVRPDEESVDHLGSLLGKGMQYVSRWLEWLGEPDDVLGPQGGSFGPEGLW